MTSKTRNRKRAKAIIRYQVDRVADGIQRNYGISWPNAVQMYVERALRLDRKASLETLRHRLTRGSKSQKLVAAGFVIGHNLRVLLKEARQVKASISIADFEIA